MQAAPPSVRSFPTPHDKATLATYLKEAAMLEHQFMCQYLYAAFSLKKWPDQSCTPAQLEVVRRWASQIYMIARQEMEHLSIANSLLTAIGYAPWFGHDNFPTQSRWYVASALQHKKQASNCPDPCDFPFLLQAFDLTVAKRFCCMESPTIDHVPQQDQPNVLEWCYENATGGCSCVPELPSSLTMSRSFVDEPGQSENVEPGTVQELYAAIESGFRYLDSEIGSKALFNGHQSGQSEIPSEYDIYLFSICNLDTALTGMRLITQQGEGIDAPPGYDSHFQNYYDIAAEYNEILKSDEYFQASLPLPLDPEIEQYTIARTRNSVEAFKDGYVAMLYMLAGYYANYNPAVYNNPPYLFQALEQSVFAPTMTMIIRSLAELITQLPDDSGGSAGPVFYLSPDVLGLLERPNDPIFLDINFHVSNLEPVKTNLEKVITDTELPKALEPKFRYVHQNVMRIMANLQYIYESGVYTKFANLPNCPQEDSCE